jgi:hypothetical protein
MVRFSQLEEVSGVETMAITTDVWRDGSMRIIRNARKPGALGTQRWTATSINVDSNFAGGRQRLRFSAERCKSSPTFKICEARRWHKRSFSR